MRNWSLLFVVAWMAACKCEGPRPEDAAPGGPGTQEARIELSGRPPRAALPGLQPGAFALSTVEVGSPDSVVTRKAQGGNWEHFTGAGWWDRALFDFQSIRGGEVAPEGRYPFAAAIARLNAEGTLTQYCGGSLIGPRAVLTAAHCRIAIGDYAVLGKHDLGTIYGKALKIVGVVAHSDFRFGSSAMENDIAIVTLAKPFAELGSPGSFVRLERSPNAAPEGTDVTAIGWGAVSLGGPGSLVLRHVTVPVANHQECAERYKTRSTIASSMLCASAPGTRDTCHGDSGGPLLLKKADGTMVQVGITSFGIGCADPRYHGVYTRVASFTSWIDSNMPR